MVQASGDSNGGEGPMRYEMLGDDESALADKLDKYTGEVDWAYLKKPFEADALLYVDPSLSLTEVGQAFADDDAEAVRAWKSKGDILQPGPPHAEYWEQTKARFTALVVSPFVLIQPLE